MKFPKLHPRESETRYKTIVDNCSEGIILQDASGKIITWNKAAEQILGISEEEAISHTFTSLGWNTIREDSSLFPGSEHPSMVTLTTGKPCNNVVMGVKNASGKIAWININTNPLFAEDPTTPSGVVASFSNITDLKQAETPAFDAAKDWQFAFDAINCATWILDSGQRIVRANKAAKRFCQSNSQMIGQQCWQLAHGTDCPIDGCPFLKAQKSLIHETTDLQIGEGWFEVAVDPIFDSAGRFSGAVHVISDIAERKQAEESLRERERLRFLHILESSLNEIYVFDAINLVFEYVNQSALKNLGYTRESMLTRMTPFDLEQEFTEVTYRQLLEPLLQNEQKILLFETVHLRYDGSVYPVEVHLQLVGLEDRQVFLAMIQDISERKLFEKDAISLHAQLKQAQKMESVGRLAGGVAHDFNNMLSVIHGYGELIRVKTTPGEDLHEFIKEIIDACVRSASITRQLLTYTRKETIIPVVLDLNCAVEDTAKMLRRLIGEDIDLAWLPNDEILPVMIDPSELGQLLANLCVNARDAIKGVGRVIIETGMATIDAAYCTDNPGSIAGEFAVLTFSDDGCGMDSNTVDRIFEPFFTTKAPGRGTGLGLAMVYGVVKQNGGFINVYSEPGKGSTFKIYLPRQDDSAIGVKCKEKAVIPPGQGQTIMLVEDEASVLKLAKRILGDLGYSVLTAAIPSHAVNLAKEYSGTIDLLVTDLVMPEMNGKELSQRLGNLCPGLKTVFMSGYTADIIAHNGILDKGVCFLQKPFTRESMAVKIREALEI